MKVEELCTYAPKSKIKAGDAVENAEYMFFTSSSDESKRYPEYQHDDEVIVMGTGGNATLHYYSGKCSVSTDCLVLLPNEMIRCKYLYYYFRANIYILEEGFKGAGLKHISKKYISNIEIRNIPELSTQDDIIDKLDKIANIITKKERELNRLDKLIKSRFVEMFGDIKNEEKYKGVPLRELCTTMSGGTPSTKKPKYYDGDIPWISTVSLGPNHIDGSKAKEYITQEAIENSATKLIPAGNILFGTRVGVGKSSINDVDMCTNQDIVAIVGIDESRFNKLFIKHVLDTYKPYFNSIKKGATILGITGDDLKESLIPDVPIGVQMEYESFVKQIDKLKVEVQKSLDKTQMLFDSLMQEYFG